MNVQYLNACLSAYAPKTSIKSLAATRLAILTSDTIDNASKRVVLRRKSFLRK
jgi:hypothetical protein